MTPQGTPVKQEAAPQVATSAAASAAVPMMGVQQPATPAGFTPMAPALSQQQYQQLHMMQMIEQQKRQQQYAAMAMSNMGTMPQPMPQSMTANRLAGYPQSAQPSMYPPPDQRKRRRIAER